MRDPIFPMLKRTIFLSIVLLAGCSKTVNVDVLPSEYRVGDVQSALATPAVDEVVRLKPSRVHISTCLTTPPAKLIQFEVELQARHKTKITGGFFKTCPEI